LPGQILDEKIEWRKNDGMRGYFSAVAISVGMAIMWNSHTCFRGWTFPGVICDNGEYRAPPRSCP